MRRLVVLPVVAILIVVGGIVAWRSLTGSETDTAKVDEPLPAATVERSDIPRDLQDASLHSTPWDAEPKTADGVMLGLGQRDDHLRFTAVRADGTELWHAQRPLACAGFTVTMAGDRAIAVLNDAEADDDDILRTTASAYDLHSGELVWGPVEVPGPNYGPGLVYAGTPDEYFGDAGPLTALDARNGKTILTESEGSDSRIIGEFDGVLVRADARTLTGQDGDGEQLWTIDAADLPWSPEAVVSVPGIDPGGRWAVIGPDQGNGVLLDTETGTIHARQVTEAIGDRMTETVAVIADGQLGVVSPEDGPVWQRPVEGSELWSIGASSVTLRSRTGLDVLDSENGSPVQTGDPAVLAPRISTRSSGMMATVLGDDERIVLAVSET